MKFLTSLILVATAVQAHCKPFIFFPSPSADFTRHIPTPCHQREIRNCGLVHDPPYQERRIQTRHRKPYFGRHPLLLVFQRCIRRDNPCRRDHSLHQQPAGQSSRPDAVLSGKGSLWKGCEELGWKWCGVVQDLDNDADCECAEANELACAEYVSNRYRSFRKIN